MKDYKAFISYRRKSGYWLAKLLHDLLDKDGYRVFFDEENNENGSLVEILKNNIVRSDFFILVISKGCFNGIGNKQSDQSNFCKEISSALEQNKTIIPVLTPDAKMPINTKRLKNKSVIQCIMMLNSQHNRYIRFHHDNGLAPYNELKGRMSGQTIKSLEVDCTVYRRVGDAIYNNPNTLRLPEGMYEHIFDSHDEVDGTSYVIVSAGDKHRIFEKVDIAKKNEVVYLNLPKGDNDLLFVSNENASDQKIDTITVGDGSLYTIDLLSIMQKRDKEESEGEKEFKVNGVRFKMIYVHGGVSNVGYWGVDKRALRQGEPKRSVEVKGFWIGETVVTQSLYSAVMGKSYEINEEDKKNGCKVGVDYPMVQVSWRDAKEFARRLSEETGRKFRLPTTEEWEYAARGGEKSKGQDYAGSSIIDEVAWYNGNSENELHPVKEKKPNELGLYDMSGNVWEWTQSEYKNERECHIAQEDSCIDEGADSRLNENGEEKLRTTRGGSFNHNDICSMVSSRSGHKVFSNYDLGFRVVMERLIS